MELFYSSGLRLSELAALDVADVDPYTESVRVFGKGRKERVCPVGLPALEAIQKYRVAANVHTGPLFINKSRRRMSVALDLAGVETLRSAHIHSDFNQPTQIAA